MKKDVGVVRRFLAVFLCLTFLWLPARAGEGEKLVALTFDDGPSGRFTRRLLEGLAERDVQATFFLCGYRLEQYPKLAREIVAAGHEVGVHGYSHKSMCAMTAGELSREIRDTLPLLPGEVRLLRPPGGACNRCIEEQARQLGLAILQWSVDPKDWCLDDAGEITRRVLQKVQDGDVILLHDMSDSSVDAALSIVDALQARGFRFVTASQLARAKNCPLTPGSLYYHFRDTDPREEK